MNLGFARRLIGWSSMAILLTALPAAGQERREVPGFRTYGGPENPDVAMAIDELVRGFKDAWSRQDTDDLIKLHADDVEWINAYARMFQGATPLAHFLEHRLFPNWPPEVSRQEMASMKMISIRYLPGAAVVHMYLDSERGASRNEGELMRRTHIHLILAEQNGDWRIVHTAIMDAR